MTNNVYQNKRLLLIILLIFIVLVSSSGIFLLNNTQKIISQTVFRQLESVREIKKSAIQDYFKERQKDLQVMIETISALKLESLNNLAIIKKSKKAQIKNYFSACFLAMDTIHKSLKFKNGLKAFSIAFQKGLQSKQYEQTYHRYYKEFKNLKESLGFYDMFLIDPHGNIIFSEKKDSYLGQNLQSESLKTTGLAKAFLKGKSSTSFIDFSWYEPSNSPAAFLATPFLNQNEKLTGVVVFQLSLNKINSIMKERIGSARTNEAYLVGPDFLMRSDSVLDPANRSVKTSFQFPENGMVQTIAAKQGINGKTGKGIVFDYRDQPVLSVWAPVKAGDVVWAIIVETDVSDAFSPKSDSEQYFFDMHKQIYGYYDLFMMNPDGYCFYTVVKEDDYQTNFVTGKYKNTNLGKLVQKVIKTKKFEMIDFQPYTPSSNSLAAFIAQPLLNNGKIELIIAAQLSPDAINKKMKQRKGMGETGETYLVGPDKRMRSDSFLDPEKYSLSASFKGNIEDNGVDTEAVRKALAGETGKKIITDYNKNKVYSAYTPLEIGDVTWATIAEIDVKEAGAQISILKWLIAVTFLLSAVACTIIIHMIAKTGKQLSREQEK